LISFDIGHLDHHCVATLKLGPGRAVAIRHKQLNGANLLVNLDMEVLAFARGDPAKLVDQLALLHLGAG